MVKAFLDTNIIVSGFVSFKHPERPPAQILHAFKAGLFEMIISKDVLIEVKETFQKPYFKNRLRPEDIAEAITFLSEEAIITFITAKVDKVATHPEDDKILAAAVSSRAHYLVTGDGPLFREVGSPYKGIKIVTPVDFLEILERQG